MGQQVMVIQLRNAQTDHTLVPPYITLSMLCWTPGELSTLSVSPSLGCAKVWETHGFLCTQSCLASARCQGPGGQAQEANT